MLIRDRLESAFGDEPPHVPIEQQLAAGQVALRRRRIGQCMAAVAAVAVISVGSVVLGGRTSDSDQRLTPATDGPTPPSASSTGDGATTTTAAAWPAPGQLAYLDADGTVHIRPDVELRRQVTVSTSGRSAAARATMLAVTKKDETWWLNLEFDQGRLRIPGETVGPFDSWDEKWFESWVADHRVRSGSTNGNGSSPAVGDEQLVHFNNGRLVAEDGVTISQERPDPGFAGFNPDGVPVAVADVKDAQGVRWFVLARANDDGTTQNISARAGVGPVPADLDDFIAWARQKYDSGEGLL